MSQNDRTAFIDGMWRDEIVRRSSSTSAFPTNRRPSIRIGSTWAYGPGGRAVRGWARAKLASLPGSTLEVVAPGPTHAADPYRDSGSDPLSDDRVLLYGHLDKQPEMTGWLDGYGPWIPRLEGDKLYGRGGADDGYAMFAALTAILSLAKEGKPHARCVILIEACEESSSDDLPYYVEHLKARIGDPSLVICLDSGCGNYDQLWLTTSLRGMLGANMTVRVLTEGVHSGDASGVVRRASVSRARSSRASRTR